MISYSREQSFGLVVHGTLRGGYQREQQLEIYTGLAGLSRVMYYFDRCEGEGEQATTSAMRCVARMEVVKVCVEVRSKRESLLVVHGPATGHAHRTC